MPRRITPQTTLDNLKKEAKRFLKALREGDETARAQFTKAYPNAPDKPGLRDVQHAIALHYGCDNWKALKEAIDNLAKVPPQLHDRDAHFMARFFEFACPDHHVRGRPAHRMAEHAVMRILKEHPEIPRDNFYTAIVCGEIDIVERVLRENPEAARLKSGAATADRTGVGGSEDVFRDIGPKGWEPLSYLCFTRLPLAKANDNAVAIARLLLDHGADPTAYFMAGDSHYTPLTGVIGEGEEDRPPHPRRDELVRLLLERGAEPYDGQVIYNIHFHGKILWYLKLMYEFSLKAGRGKDWLDPEWHMLDQGGYGTGARWHLRSAIEHNDLELATWCLEHGANPNSPPEKSKHFSKNSLYEQAVLLGESEMAELLARYGATRIEPAGDSEDAFVAACFRLDRAAAEALAKQHPEYLKSNIALHKAAEQNRTDVVELLLDLGVDVNVENPGKATALHAAAYKGAAEAVDTLIRHGAKIDPVDSMHDATPLWWAMWSQQDRVVTLLARYSRDVWALNFTGHLERVREVLAAEPRFATMSGESTPLFWLPDDEQKAVATVELFLSLGADASFRRKADGLTAADVARRRGLNAAADMLAAAEKKPPVTPAMPKSAEVDRYQALARNMVKAYASGDDDAMRGIKDHFGRSFNVDDVRAIVWRTTYKVRQASGSAEAFQLAEAQELIARSSGFPNWPALIEAVATGKGAPGPPFGIETKDTQKLYLRRIPTPKDWDTIIAVMKEQRISALEAQMMTDEALDRISRLGFVTRLSLGGSGGMSDDGMQYLARMPQLESLNLSEYPGGKLTDRGLEVLRHLPNLKHFEMTWQKGITDKGAANLKYCDDIETVNLMGSPTGDGVIEALRGKAKLRHFSTGRLVTDAGLPMLHEYPMFKTWHGGEPDRITGPQDSPTKLLIDGPFSDDGLAGLAGLEGVFELDLFWHVTNITDEGFAHLIGMPNLASLGCDGRLATDVSFRHIAAIPRLRRLRAQEAVATEDGWVALSASKTLENIWGRECPNFGNRAFIALSKMSKLRGFGIGCQRVDDAALSTLPQFPSLREITPVGFQDWGFRHIGKCEKLEKLTCMYCRETGDTATEHIAGLRLKSYYAGLTQITDRSLEILGRMTSLEVVELFETKSITDKGLAFLANLPNLQRVEFSGMPNITLAGTKVFPARVQVNWDV